MLKLIKTSNGHAGSPTACSCGSKAFTRAGIAWACESCGYYVPARLNSGGYDSLRNSLNELNRLHGNLQFKLTELEQILGKV
jgi:hypothetical protein